MRGKLKKHLSMFLVMMMIVSSLNLPVAAVEAPTMANHIVISQIYGAGGYGSALYQNDFIELYNPTDSPVDLSGWTVQYASSAAGKTYAATALSGSIDANSFYLIQLYKGGDVGTTLPTPDAVGSTNLSSSKGKIALVSNGDVIVDISDVDIVDFVGYGDASEYEVSPASVNSGEALVRLFFGVDTDNNSNDFTSEAPLPHSGSLVEETKCATPTASVDSGHIIEGIDVTFSTSTEGAQIQYNVEAANAVNWTTSSAINVTTSATYYVVASKDGLDDSDIATFTYVVDDSTPITIGEAKALADDTENVKVKGIVTYIKYSDVYIQDNTGAIVVKLTADASKLSVGDEIIALGQRSTYYNIQQISHVDEDGILVVSRDNDIPDLGTTTIDEIIETPTDKTPGFTHMGEIIGVENATLDSTGLLSQGDDSIKIYPSVDLSDYIGVSVGDQVDAKVRVYDYKGTLEVEVVDMYRTGEANVLYMAALPAGGPVNSGSTVTLKSNDEMATIFYTLDGTQPTASSPQYTGPITIEGEIGDTITLKAFAIALGKDDSNLLEEVYTIKDPNVALTLKDVLELPSNTENVKVRGQLVYFAQAYDNPVIQADVEGQRYALYVYGSAPEGAAVGDIIELTGKYTIYNGLPELTGVTEASIISHETPMDLEEITVENILSQGLNKIGQVVRIKDVTLGDYNGSGSTVITDATGSINIYKATPYPTLVEKGDVVDVVAMIACYNTSVQLYTGNTETNGFNVYDVVNDTKAPQLTLNDKYLDAKPGQDYKLTLKADDNKGIDTVLLTYTIGSQTVSDAAMVYDASTLSYAYTIPGDQILASETQIRFQVTVRDVSGLETVSDQQMIEINDAPQITIVSPMRNSATGDDKSPLIAVELENVGEEPSVKVTLEKDSVKIIDQQDMTFNTLNIAYEYVTQDLEDGNYTVTVNVERQDSKSGQLSWNFTVGELKYKAYFGQLHAHTAQYSDGSGTLADGLNYIKNLPDSENVDFTSFTDHSNYFDTTSAANPAEALNDKTLMTPESLNKWNDYVSTMAQFNQENSGDILAFPGFEMTWSGGPGHINTFNSDGLVSRNNKTLNSKTADAGMKAYYDTLIQNTDPLANLSQFNHPGSTFGTFSDFAYWSASYDNKMVAVEVGNGEGAINSGGYFQSYNEYTKALDKGWHVAPTNNQDNHKGHWGNANTARTVIITDQLSQEGLLRGLKEMSVYASEDKNLNIDYSINNMMMGSIIKDVPESALQVVVNIDDPDSDDVISKVEVITNSGRIVASETFTTNAINWEFELPSVQGYYYLRVTQADKNLAVTAPIWIGQAPLVGISSVETNTLMPVTHEALDVKTTVFNNEETEVVLKNITYESQGQVIKTESLDQTLVSAGTFEHTLTYTPETAGIKNISVQTVFEVNGEEKAFEQSVELNVRDADKLVYVGIDASHHNEYVSGNYKESMGNFANLAVQTDIRVVELNSSEDLMSALQNPKYEMMVITPPTRRNGNGFLLDYANYTNEEIEAIKDFVARGKTIIVTGWGDYYESYSEYSDGTPYELPANDQMSAQQNRLLEAIGSTLRVSDDEIKDDVNNGGQPQRLYLTEYNLDNPFAKAVDPNEQVYSNYGGSTLYGVDETNMPSTSLKASVSPIVYAFETSYSSDDDKDGTTGIDGVSVPKYDNKYLVAASERLTFDNGNAGTVIVAGSAFMSNFEIQVSMDSYATPAYSNYTIVEAILESVNPPLITSISEIQAAEEGQVFYLEGIVTSNASGFDKDTAFFDCIYVQDETGGINAFPVAGDIASGQTVRIKGTTSAYNGERQIAVESVKILDETRQPLPNSIRLTTKQASEASDLGSLVNVIGTVTEIEYVNNVVESIYLKDASGVACRVFIDGYITSTKTIKDLAIGRRFSATGLSSIDTLGARIRIRDRDDIIYRPIKDSNDTKNPTNPTTPEDKVKVVTPPQEEIDKAIASGEVNLEVGLGDSDSVEAQLNGEDVKKLKETKTLINVTVDKVTYSLPSDEIDASLLEEGGKVVIEIAKAPEKVQAAIDVLKANNPQIQFLAPMQFEVKIVNPNGESKIDTFKTFVTRTFELGEDMDTDHLVGIVFNEDEETYEPVPLKIVVINGVKYAQIASLSNSVYSAMTNEVSVDTVSGHWSETMVNTFASRQIISKVAQFKPDQAITRGEFVELLVRGFGLYRSGIVDNQFNDISSDPEVNNAINIAAQYDLISGYPDGTFKPDALITRQEAAVILASAIDYVTIEDLKNQTINDFKDQGEVADWASEAVDKAVSYGVYNGSDGAIKPLQNITMAETVAAIYNMLLQAGLIN